MSIKNLCVTVLALWLVACDSGVSSKDIPVKIASTQAISLEIAATGNQANEALIQKAREITTKYKLTSLSMDCLAFEVLAEPYDGKTMIDVREVHNSQCGGDPAVSPRLFSIGIDQKTGEAWSDANSDVGQLEKL